MMRSTASVPARAKYPLTEDELKAIADLSVAHYMA